MGFALQAKEFLPGQQHRLWPAVAAEDGRRRVGADVVELGGDLVEAVADPVRGLHLGARRCCVGCCRVMLGRLAR